LNTLYNFPKGIFLEKSTSIKLQKIEGLDMLYVIQKNFYFFLGYPFKKFNNHFALRYLVNNPKLEGLICRWLFLFKEFKFEVVVNHRNHNVGPHHLSRIKSSENESGVDGQFPDETYS
jgi:hypothetical protein